MQPAKKINPAIAAVIVIVLVGIVTSVVLVVNNNSAEETPAADSSSQGSPSTPSPVESSAGTEPSSTNTSNYKDGTYNATGTYSTPGGRESIDLTVTITDGVITATELKENAQSGEARTYQADFASGYKTLVVGKSVDEVTLSRVAGSSLTSNGFNQALEQIKSDAA